MTNPGPNDERMRNLKQLSSAVEKRSLRDYDFKRATGSLSEDLEFIAAALNRDCDMWRLNRAFHSVHVPSFLAVVSMLDNIDDMKSISEAERHQIYASIHRATQLASAAREQIEHSVLTDAKVEVAVLADYAPVRTEEFKKASLLERTRDGLAVGVSDDAEQGEGRRGCHAKHGRRAERRIIQHS